MPCMGRGERGVCLCVCLYIIIYVNSKSNAKPFHFNFRVHVVPCGWSSVNTNFECIASNWSAVEALFAVFKLPLSICQFGGHTSGCRTWSALTHSEKNSLKSILWIVVAVNGECIIKSYCCYRRKTPATSGWTRQTNEYIELCSAWVQCLRIAAKSNFGQWSIEAKSR